MSEKLLGRQQGKGKKKNKLQELLLAASLQ